MTDDTPLDVMSAVSLMTTPATPPASGTGTPAQDDQNKTPPASTPEPAPAAQGDNAPPADTSSASGAPAAAATDDPPAQGDAPAAADGQAEPGSLPPIEPPSSWKAEQKELFKALPRATQEEVARIEQARSTEIRNLQNTTAEQRKQAEGEVAKLTEITQRVDAVLNERLNALAAEFPDVKTPADLERLAATDPNRYNVLQAKLTRFNADKQAADQAKTVLATKQQEQFQAQLAASRTELLKTFPTWNDTAVLRKEMTEIQDYAISLGCPEPAARNAIDPVVYKAFHKAMLYDRAQAALAKAQNRTPAPVVKPGTISATPRQDRAAADRGAGMRKLGETGDIMDAVSLMLVK